MSERFQDPVTSALRERAISLPETTEGTSCVNRAFKVRNKNFLFVGEKDDGSRKAMLKLKDSLEQAEALAENDGRFEVGSAGWTTIRFDVEDRPDVDLLENWVVESYRLFAPKSLSKQVQDS